MNNTDFIELAREFVAEYCNSKGLGEITEENVLVVWAVKVLQNNKAILCTETNNNLFEFTWNGDKQEGYLDFYKKEDNAVIRNEGAV